MSDQHRDTSRTGVSEGPASNYITIGMKGEDKQGKFIFNGNPIGHTLRAYLDKVSIEWRDPVPEHDIPAHWAVNLLLTLNLGDGDKQYTLPIGSHWSNPIMANLMNGIAGALEQDAVWIRQPMNRFVRIWLNVKQPVGKRPYVTANIYRSEEKGDYLPSKHPFNEGLLKYEGVPSDMDEATKYWLGLANDIRKITGGIVINQAKATFPLPPGVLPEPNGNGAPDTQQTPPPPTTTTPAAQASQVKPDAFMKKMRETYLIHENPEALLSGLKSSLQGMVKLKPEGVTAAKIIREFNTKLHQFEPGANFIQQGDTDAKYVPPAEDDLPF